LTATEAGTNSHDRVGTLSAGRSRPYPERVSFFKVVLVIGAIAAGVLFGAKWMSKNPHSTDINRISPPAYQLPGPQDPYGNTGR
jgi:hypothetical protein